MFFPPAESKSTKKSRITLQGFIWSQGIKIKCGTNIQFDLFEINTHNGREMSTRLLSLITLLTRVGTHSASITVLFIYHGFVEEVQTAEDHNRTGTYREPNRFYLWKHSGKEKKINSAWCTATIAAVLVSCGCLWSAVEFCGHRARRFQRRIQDIGQRSFDPRGPWAQHLLKIGFSPYNCPKTAWLKKQSSGQGGLRLGFSPALKNSSQVLRGPDKDQHCLFLAHPCRWCRCLRTSSGIHPVNPESFDEWGSLEEKEPQVLWRLKPDSDGGINSCDSTVGCSFCCPKIKILVCVIFIFKIGIGNKLDKKIWCLNNFVFDLEGEQNIATVKNSRHWMNWITCMCVLLQWRENSG